MQIVFRRQLQEALDAGAGVFRALPLITMRQQQHDSGGQVPFVFGGGNKLIDNHLRAIGEISELRLPCHQRFRIVSAITVFESQYGCFR